jgi:hypothetical protein
MNGSNDSVIEKPLKHYRWSWVYGKDRELYHSVWIEPDGSLHNPRNYPEEPARAAALAADQRKADRLRESRERGVKKRRERREARIQEAAKRILRKEGIGNSDHCYCCHKFLTDPESIGRAIGSECWQHVLDIVARLEKDRADAGAAAGANTNTEPTRKEEMYANTEV